MKNFFQSLRKCLEKRNSLTGVFVDALHDEHPAPGRRRMISSFTRAGKKKRKVKSLVSLI